MATHRKGRINEEMKKELSQIILRELKDPRITAMVTVTAVEVTADLKYAKVFLSIFSPNKEEEKTTLEAIKKAAGFIRTRLSKTINLRLTPQLLFSQDTTINYGMHIDELLKQVIPASGDTIPLDRDGLEAAADEAGNETGEDSGDLEEADSAGDDDE